MNILDFNKHWQKDYVYDYPFHRVYFDELVKKQKDMKYILLLVGLRRVGKTTLMLQMINTLLSDGIDRDAILYYSFDAGGDIENTINEYLKLSNKDILEDELYIYFDEIQKVPDWQNKIKVYYDLYSNIHFVLSGSSSVFLHATESLAGRIETIKIKPLFFQEFLSYKDKAYLLGKPALYQKNIILEFEKYLYRQFFDIIDTSILDAQKYTQQLKNKIIKEDAKHYFSLQYPDLLVQLFDIIAKSPGMILDYQSLGSDLGIDRRTVQTYIHYLQESYLVHKVYNFSTNPLSLEKKQKKVYLSCCSFATAQGVVSGELFENYVQNQLDCTYFWRFNKKEVNFVVLNDNKDIVAIEVKYKDDLSGKAFKGLRSFSEKFNVSGRFLISKCIGYKSNDVQIFPFRDIQNRENGLGI